MLGFAALSEKALSELPSSGAVTPVAVGAITLDLIPDGTATFTAGAVPVGVGAIDLNFAFSGTTTHGVHADEAITFDLVPAGTAKHGIRGTGDITLGLTPAGIATHLRYEVTGVVKLGGILVNRQVRVYLRSSGALLGQAATTAGSFKIHTGFNTDEVYVVPIHLDVAATDYIPPTGNRIVPVLAQD
jgi:hypothetical protein